MYWEVWYNNKSLPENQSLIYYENLLLGVPRLRQVKVHNDSCSIHEDLRDEVQDCYNMYTPTNEDTRPFGPKNGTAYVNTLQFYWWFMNGQKVIKHVLEYKIELYLL